MDTSRDTRNVQTAPLLKQNEFLRSYIVRLEKQLEDWLGSHVPPPETVTEEAADKVPPWFSDSSVLSPLFEAYDRRISELEISREGLAAQLSSLQLKIKSVTAENDRYAAEVKQLTQLAASASDQGDSQSNYPKDVELEQRNELLVSENDILSEENEVLRKEISKLNGQVTSNLRQVNELQDTIVSLRRKISEMELKESQGASSAMHPDTGRMNHESQRLRMELEVSSRECKVLQDQMQSCRDEIRGHVVRATDLKSRHDEIVRQLQTEKTKHENEISEMKKSESMLVQKLTQLQHELEDIKTKRDEEVENASLLRRNLDDTEKMLKNVEQQLFESRSREDTLKGQCRRFEEVADEHQIAADQAQALEQQARREIARLSDKLQEVLVEAQQRSEETVSSIRSKYRSQKSNLQQQIRELDAKVAELQTENERLSRERMSAEAEIEKLLQNGPGGCISRMQKEIEDLQRQCKDLALQRDDANHSMKAIELSSRRKQALWDQSQQQSSAQIEQLERKAKVLITEMNDLKDQCASLQTQLKATEQKAKDLEEAKKEQEVEFETRIAMLREKSQQGLLQLEDRVRVAEESEEASKAELASLLDAHDKLQSKWREASREMATQTQRHIQELKENIARLEERNNELNKKLVTVIAERANALANLEKNERSLERLRALLEASEKREKANKEQISQLIKGEAELLKLKKTANFELERQQLNVQRLEKEVEKLRKVTVVDKATFWSNSVSLQQAKSRFEVQEDLTNEDPEKIEQTFLHVKVV
eukprot:691858-Hanusia_phi.AAC.1